MRGLEFNSYCLIKNSTHQRRSYIVPVVYKLIVITACAQELIKVGVMHTTSPTRAQRQDGTVPSVLDLMHQTQLQQVTRCCYRLIVEQMVTSSMRHISPLWTSGEA